MTGGGAQWFSALYDAVTAQLEHELDSLGYEGNAEGVESLERVKAAVAGVNAKRYAESKKCTGYCVGTEKAATLVEDLACPVHGIEAQEKAKALYPDRQAWLDALRAANSQASTGQ